MSYYPNNRIKTNLFTNGDELIIESSKKDYKGYYYETFDNKFYIGRDNSVVPVVKLIQKPKPRTQGKSTILDTIKNIVYQNIKIMPFGK